jgi:hypothetical protein
VFILASHQRKIVILRFLLRNHNDTTPRFFILFQTNLPCFQKHLPSQHCFPERHKTFHHIAYLHSLKCKSSKS